jgi:predicted DNA-binding transcriptional regulator YafY
MRKADRLFQLVNLIRTYQPITAQQLAERIGVSVRTIYRYIDDISISGIPVYGEPGIGYFMDKDFELPPLSLNKEELTALMLGVEMLSRATGNDLAQAAKTMKSKIEAVLPPQSLGATHKPVQALGNILNDQTLKHWNDLYRAIQEQKAIRIVYLSLSEQLSSRIVFPLGLFYWGEKWTVGTWCVLRSSYRDFRVDRIQNLDKADYIESPGQQISLKAYTHFNAEAWRIAKLSSLH